MNEKMTDQEVQKLYDTLENMDTHSNADKLEEASNETDTTVYSEIEEYPNANSLGVPTFDEEQMKELGLSDETIEDLKNIDIDPNDLNIEETKSDYMEVFDNYDLSDEDTHKLLSLISKYKENPSGKYYDELPNKLKIICDGMRSTSGGVTTSKDSTARFILDSMINDAKMGKAVDDFNKELSDLMMQTDKDYQDILNESFDEMYNRLDQIKSEDPEQAAKIELMHNAMEDAKILKRQNDYLDKGITAKKLKKYTERYKDACFYFNKKVINECNIKMPDIRKLSPIIKKALPGYTEFQIKEFIIVLIRSSYELDMTDLNDIIYIYRILADITLFEYSVDFESEKAKQVFGAISNVIDRIIAL